jgi:predicted MPP superfamily phosphohydrolase
MKGVTTKLQLGLRAPLEIREEHMEKGSPPCRIAYVSDIHLRMGRSGLIAGHVVDACSRAAPDLILLGGDLVDQASALDELTSLVSRICEIAPVFAILGNHDRSVGETQVSAAVVAGGGSWIEGKIVRHIHGSRVFAICGTGAGPDPGTTINILCTHYPQIGGKVWAAGFDLVLAGHLHGCQCVLFEAAGRMYPGALFYTHNRLRLQKDNTRLVISRGCSDLIPIRWNCPREIVLCIL